MLSLASAFKLFHNFDHFRQFSQQSNQSWRLQTPELKSFVPDAPQPLTLNSPPLQFELHQDCFRMQIWGGYKGRKFFFYRFPHFFTYSPSIPFHYDTVSDHLESLSTNVPEILTAGKTAFWEDTNLDKLTSEQAGTPNFKSINIFNMFSLVRKVQNEL